MSGFLDKEGMEDACLSGSDNSRLCDHSTALTQQRLSACNFMLLCHRRDLAMILVHCGELGAARVELRAYMATMAFRLSDGLDQVRAPIIYLFECCHDKRNAYAFAHKYELS